MPIFDDAISIHSEGLEPYSYLTVADAEVYFQGRLNSEVWDSASDTDKEKALASATRLIDRLNFEGAKTDPNQVAEFPRNGNETIPKEIGIAACEIAIALLDGVDCEKEIEKIHITNIRYAGVSETYDRSIAVEHWRAGIPSAVAWSYLRAFLHDPAQINFSRV
jgi:hypothetical protein